MNQPAPPKSRTQTPLFPLDNQSNPEYISVMAQQNWRTLLMIAVLALGSSCSHMFMAKWPPATDPLQGWTGWIEADPTNAAMGRIAIQP